MRLPIRERTSYGLGVLAAIAIAAIAGRAVSVLGHENHAPLPTKGVKIQGDEILVSAKGREAIGLTLAKVTLGDLCRSVRASARVELPWRQQAMITSLVPGKVERVLVRPGQPVAPGQELARVASMELQTLQAEMLRAATELALARRLVDQRTHLDREGAIAGKNVLEAQSVLAQKVAQFEIAQQKLRSLGFSEPALERIRATGLTVRELSLTSPIGGTITHADVRVGQVVQPTEHLVHVVDVSTVWIVGEVPEGDVGRLGKGQEVTASFAALPGELLRGKVDHLRLRIDPQTRTQAVVVAVDNRDGRLRPGMSGRVAIEVQVAHEAVFCPADALIESRSGVYVLVERGEGKYVNQMVNLGLRSEGRVEVLDGLFPGDRVVAVGNYLLASLLGNEHKARVTSDPSRPPPPSPGLDTSDRVVVAQATVELPTDRQGFATSRIEGRVARVCVDPSQAVRAGEVMAEVESLELRNLQLDLVQTAAKGRWTQEQLTRLEAMADQGGAPKKQVWQLENDLLLLRQAAANLGRKLSFAGLTDEQVRRLEQAEITPAGLASAIVPAVPVRAPVDGWIVGCDLVPGQIVRPDDKLFEIHDLSKVWAKGYVFERDAARVRVGQAAKVTFSAYPKLSVDGTVIRVAPVMESTERVLPVWVEIANPDLRLKQGMLARMALEAGMRDQR